MEHITVEIIGIVGILLIQLGQTARAWITKKASATNVKVISEELVLIQKKLISIENKNEKEHANLSSYISKIDERTELNSFIPGFEIKMEAHINNTLSGFSFDNKKVKSMTRSIASKGKDTFCNILKVGFSRYDSRSLKESFDVQEMAVSGIVESHKLAIDTEKLFKIIEIEKESFIVQMEDILEESNGVRQESFSRICRNYIFNVVKEISSL